MKQELLREQLAVLEVLAKVNQSGHKCNTEIKELVETVKATLKDVEEELAIFHDEDSELDEEEGYEDEL